MLDMAQIVMPSLRIDSALIEGASVGWQWTSTTCRRTSGPGRDVDDDEELEEDSEVAGEGGWASEDDIDILC